MKKTFMIQLKFRVSIVVVILAITVVSNTFADQPSNVRLSLKSEKDRYLLGEPVRLTATIQNHGKSPLVLIRYSDAFKINVIRGSMRELVDQSNPLQFNKIVDPIQLHSVEKILPGQSGTMELRLFWSRNNHQSESFLAFDEPGEFDVEVQFVHYRSAEAIATSSTKIIVESPKGDDLKAWQIYNHEGVFSTVQFGDIDKLVGSYRDLRASYKALAEEITRPETARRAEQKIDALDAMAKKMGLDAEEEVVRRITQLRKLFPKTVYGRLVTPPHPNPPKTDADDGGDKTLAEQATEQLIKAGYDIKMIIKQNPDAYEQYLVEAGDLADRYADGEIDYDEFEDQDAVLWRSWVVKHGKLKQDKSP